MTFRHWAGFSPYTSSCEFAETCVFGKQSPESLYCDPLARVPLLPKLRGLFAEFLNEGYLERLGIFFPHTCVGFGTVVELQNLEVLSRQQTLKPSPARRQDRSRLGLALQAFDSQHPHRFDEHPTVRALLPVASPHRSIRRLLNINRIPISYAFRLHLRGRLTLGRKS